MEKQLIAAYLLNLFDLWMTLRLTAMYGAGIESNPIGGWLIENGFATSWKVLGVGVATLALHIGIERKPRWAWTARLVLAAYGALAVYHIVIYFYQ